MAGQPTRSVWIDEAFLPCLSLCLAMLWSHLSKRSWNFVFSPSRQIINQQLMCPISLQDSVLKEFLLGRLDNELVCGGCSTGCLLGKWFKGSGFESPKRNLIYFLFFSPIQLKRKLKRRNSNIIMIFCCIRHFFIYQALEVVQVVEQWAVDLKDLGYNLAVNLIMKLWPVHRARL